MAWRFPEHRAAVFVRKLRAVLGKAGAVASWFRSLPARKKVAVTILAGGIITVLLPNCWINLSTRGHLFDDVGSVPERTAAIVPGAAVWPSGRPSNALRYRLEAAAALYRAGRVSRILVSGDHGQTDYDGVNTMRRWLVRAGVPSSRVYLDHAGFRTLDTAGRARWAADPDHRSRGGNTRPLSQSTNQSTSYPNATSWGATSAGLPGSNEVGEVRRVFFVLEAFGVNLNSRLLAVGSGNGLQRLNP